MTGYHISIGYLSGGDLDKEEAFDVLKSVVLELCHGPARVIDEAVRGGMDPRVASEYFVPFVGATAENHGTEDSSLRIIEGERAEGNPQIMMLAGGADPSRTHKEHIRRAFCRVIMREMHRLDLEVNINVA